MGSLSPFQLSKLVGELPNPGTELGSPALQVDSLPTELSRKPVFTYNPWYSCKINSILAYFIIGISTIFFSPLDSLTKDFSISSVFLNNNIWVLLISFYRFSFSYYISTLIFLISFLHIALSSVCSCFSIFLDRDKGY